MRYSHDLDSPFIGLHKKHESLPIYEKALKFLAKEGLLSNKSNKIVSTSTSIKK